MPDPVSSLTTGSTLVDVLIAVATVWGGKGVGSMAMRRFTNGLSDRTQSLTRADLREELEPLIEAVQGTEMAIREHTAYVKGRMNGKADG